MADEGWDAVPQKQDQQNVRARVEVRLPPKDDEYDVGAVHDRQLYFQANLDDFSHLRAQ